MYLENNTIKLRALEPEDLDILYRWENDSDVWTVSNAVEPYSRYILKEYIAYSDKTIYEKKQLRLMIELKDTEDVVGTIDIFDFDVHNKRAGIGILVDGKYRGHGYASHALTLVTEYAFRFLHLHQLYAHVVADNTASHNLFANQGFALTGVMKEWLCAEDQFIDVTLYQKFAQE